MTGTRRSAPAPGPWPRARPGQNFEPDEPYGDSTAAEVFERRTGLPLGDDIGALSISSTVDANDGLPFDAEAGALGRTLTEHGFGRAVIANADEDELQPRRRPLPPRSRAGDDGHHGTRPRRARRRRPRCRRIPTSPFGLRLDRDKVMRAFTAAWKRARQQRRARRGFGRRARQCVPWVRGSRATRRDAHQGAARDRPARRSAARARSIRRATRCSSSVRTTAPCAARSRSRRCARPGVEVGFLKTGTTRRTGFVQIVDVAPTHPADPRARTARGDGRPAVRRRAEHRVLRVPGEDAGPGQPGRGVPRQQRSARPPPRSWCSRCCSRPPRC